MSKRPLPWQLEKQRTAKAMLTLPKCEQCGIKRGMGWNRDGLWICVGCAVEQRAQRERT